ncbi:uncharacterized protein [Aristolochia californica]|uniref:uncharacterized protein n=1 Tax=Aristolochia californica TaxID=171875 RepID=UPI0035DDED4C
MAACSFDMQFTYVLAGWGGLTADSHVLKEALTRRDKIFVPQVDASYENHPGFLAPYRGTQYHLQEFGDNIPRNEKKLFNRRHLSLRNTIERTFDSDKNCTWLLHIAQLYICGEDYDDLFEDEDDDSGGELSRGGDAVQLGAMEDIDSDNSDGLEDEGSQVTSFRRSRRRPDLTGSSKSVDMEPSRKLWNALLTLDLFNLRNCHCFLNGK